MQSFPALAIAGMAIGMTIVTSGTIGLFRAIGVSTLGSSIFAAFVTVGWLLVFNCWYKISSRLPR